MTSITSLIFNFWEYPQIVEQLRALNRSLFAPLVEHLRFESRVGDSMDTIQLRKMAILVASAGRDKSMSNCDKYMKANDDSYLLPNHYQAIFTNAVRFGGRAEFDVLLKIIEEPFTPSLAIGSTENLGLIQELFSYILTKARDQDVNNFCRGLRSNFFKDNYETFSKRFSTSAKMRYMVEACFPLSTQADYEDIKEFFKDNDTSRYSMALAQALDRIQTRIAFIERSVEDLSDWLTEWKKRSVV
ncbi:hypothetical protein C8J57DRAFT_1310192 [Mycena rebaudengoi]|nr:hypothetical protein C8J57DRAFT_1310192 [Mycena rebaudengoi]